MERILNYKVETENGAPITGSVKADGVVHVRVPLVHAKLKRSQRRSRFPPPKRRTSL